MSNTIAGLRWTQSREGEIFPEGKVFHPGARMNGETYDEWWNRALNFHAAGRLPFGVTLRQYV